MADKILPSLLEDRVTYAFFQFIGTSPDQHDLSKIIKNALAITLALVVACHQARWTCICPFCLNIP